MEASWRKYGPGVRYYRARFPRLGLGTANAEAHLLIYGHVSNYLLRGIWPEPLSCASANVTGFDVDT